MQPFLVHGWRSWQSARVLALLAAAALAVGIGSTTAIYTVVQAVMLRPLAYEHGDRYVALFGARFAEPGQIESSTYPDLIDYRDRTHSFDVFGIYQPEDINLTAPGPPQFLKGIAVSASLVNGLGVRPALGRWFGDGTRDDLAVISNSLWRRLGGRTDVVGTALTLNQRVYTVSGVMPPGFRLPAGGVEAEETRNDVWVPLTATGRALNRSYAYYFCYARLKPGVTLAQAREDVTRVGRQIALEHPAEHPGYTVVLTGVVDSLVKDIRPTLLLLLGAAVALLLITCANVAGLLLARSIARARETAVRVALGARGYQLAAQYFVEGLLLSIAGAAGGILVSFGLMRFVLSVAADEIPRADDIRIDWPVLLFALATAVLSSVIFSLAPLWQALRTHPNDVLTDGVRASAGARSRGLSRSLVVAEIVLAFLLVSVGALLVTQLGRLGGIKPGFDPDGLVVFHLNADPVQFPDVAHLEPYQTRLLKALDAIPGVSGAAFANQLALAGCCFTTYLFPEGRIADRNRIENVVFLIRSPDYFRTMGIPLIEGRIPDERDAHADIPLAVIDQAAARYYWPGRSPVGAYARVSVEDGTRIQIAGVVGDVKNKSLTDPTTPELIFLNANGQVNQMTFMVRSSVPPAVLFGEIRRAVQSVNPLQPIYGTATMHELVVNSIARQRLQSFMVSFFALAALLMAVLGVYGVVSYSVRQRTVEIGMRMAIGAASRDLFRMVIGDGLKMAGYGIGIGAAASLAAALLLRANVFGIEIGDPRPFLFSTVTIGGLTVLACFFPALRATLLSPLVAIRNDPGSIWENARGSLRRAASKVADLVAAEEEPAPGGESELLVEIAESGRRAGSFAEATETALGRLRDRIGASSIALFVQRAAGQPYRSGERALPSNALLLGRLRGYDGALPVGVNELDAAERWAEAQAPGRLPEIAALREIGAALAMRVALTDEIAGILFVGPPSGRERYRAFEKRLLRGAATQFAMLIENARLTERIVEQERTRRELAMATEVQKRLFPERPPKYGNLQLAGVSIPARSVGGDYYDFLDLGGRRIGLALADVAGKGIAAALIMSVVQASLRSLAGTEGVSLAQLAAKMNRLLHRSTGASSYATFFYAEIDEEHRRLRYVNAGHNPPFLLRDGEIRELPAGGTIIGMFAQSTYEEAELDLAPGDVLLAFSDGVPEALNPRDEEFGEERLQAALRAVAPLAVEEMAEKLLAELTAWIADAAQYDDMTFVLMKVK